MGFANYLTSAVVVMRVSGSNVSGSWEETYSTASQVNGNLETLEVGGWERFANDKREGYYRFRLYTEPLDLEDTDIIQIDGTQYEVDYISQWTIGHTPHTEAILILRK